MNIFGIGGAELVLIFLIMLIVAGPQRMIRWAYWLGVYTGKLRKMWAQTMSVVQQEIDAAGVDIQLPKEMPTRQNMGQVARQVMKPLTNEFEKAAKSVEQELQPIQEDIQTAKQTLNMNNLKLTQPRTNGTVAVAPKSSPAAKPAEAPPPPKPDTNPNFGSWSAPASKKSDDSSDTLGTWGGTPS
jgi:Sec-independent protein translocase protein TatA